MSVEVREERGVQIASLSGEIDLEEAPAVRAALLACAEKGGEVIVDLSAVTYIDSSGIASLVETLQKTQETGGGLRLAAVSDQARRVLDLAKLTLVFTIEDTVDSALAGLG